VSAIIDYTTIGQPAELQTPTPEAADPKAVTPGPASPAPRLVAGTELIGQVEGSGLREPPYLIRRCDGQVVQLSELLFVVARCMDGSDTATVAARVGGELNLRIAPEQIEYVAEHNLAPLGVISPDGSVPPGLQPRNAVLALRHRVGIMPAAAVQRCAGVLSPLFRAPVVAFALLALAATDAWLIPHGIGTGLHQIIRTPLLALALFALTLASLGWHELGHAAACRHGGARPGRIGVGIYLVWPAFYTDVTDSYRLGKAGRLRTDLGGVYFNALFGLCAMGVFLLTGFAPLLVLVAGQQLLLVDQFIPWMRLDGYHIVSDLIGVSDLFERIRPVVASLRPGSGPHPRVIELKRWARIAVTIWVLSTVVVLATMLTVVILDAPVYITSGWASIVIQARQVGSGFTAGDVVRVLISAISIAMLSLPAVGVLFTYVTLCRGAGNKLGMRREASTLGQPPVVGPR
jgi:putative peptide zinc metalloprotease protein